MNYIGSKVRLSQWIKDEITQRVGGALHDKVFCDIFAGTGTIGRVFKKFVKKVISNDIEEYSYILCRNYIQNHEPITNASDLLYELNLLPLREDGFIYKNYCLGSGSGRQYFSDENGKKIDAARNAINDWKAGGKIDNDTYYFLLASLLESADKVANTTSVYGAFLKYLKLSAQKSMNILPSFFELNNNAHEAYQEESNVLIRKIRGDILYLDPPYNERQYGANYHILNTIAKYDNFTPEGKTGMRKYYRSNYCKKQKVLDSFEDLIKNADFKYIFLSYNNEGLMSENEIRQIMQKYGGYDLVKKAHQRYKADNKRAYKADLTLEYLHILYK
ncbi:MAG: DNA adenine methylase [Campylobacteraceae bacterium]|jgi:adenine-specific DNA-methyltransferase|nr:DNA adenine methylase [Campylobacteraceae bacterium]